MGWKAEPLYHFWTRSNSGLLTITRLRPRASLFRPARSVRGLQGPIPPDRDRRCDALP
jgi:hypothetical protein